MAKIQIMKLNFITYPYVENIGYICRLYIIEFMNRFISAVILSLTLLSSCSEDIFLTPGISFLTPSPEVYEETAIFRIIGQPFTSADSLKIPVTLGGTAQKGTDYEISSEYFTLSKESLMDSIVVTTKTLGTGKTVSLSLEIPEGFTAGKYPASEFMLQDKYGLLSFETSKSFVADSTSLAIVLTDTTGNSKVLSKPASVEFKVNTEKSTAVLGEDFRLANADNLMIAAGTGYASFGIVPLKAEVNENKNKVVLNLHSDARFDTGEFAEIELTLVSPELKALEGNWVMESILTDSLYFESFWGESCTGYSLVPEKYTSNLVGISFIGATFRPSFVYGLEKYFIGNSLMSIGQKMELVDIDGNSKTVQLISLDNTNRYFTPDQISEDSNSYVGIYLYTDPETQSSMMELYILDHTSRSFMPELEAGNIYRSEKPVAVDPGLYLCTTFARL